MYVGRVYMCSVVCMGCALSFFRALDSTARVCVCVCVCVCVGVVCRCCVQLYRPHLPIFDARQCVGYFGGGIDDYSAIFRNTLLRTRTGGTVTLDRIMQVLTRG